MTEEEVCEECGEPLAASDDAYRPLCEPCYEDLEVEE